MGKARELAAKRGMAEARVPESSAGSWGLFPLNALNCENSFVSRGREGGREEQTALTRSTEMINDKRGLGSGSTAIGTETDEREEEINLEGEWNEMKAEGRGSGAITVEGGFPIHPHFGRGDGKHFNYRSAVNWPCRCAPRGI